MDNLIKLRKERNLTNKDMGNILNVSKSTYNNWEIGRTEPDINTLKKLSDFFGVTIDFLVGVPPKKLDSAVQGRLRFLSDVEIYLLDCFDKLSLFERESILIQVKALAEKTSKKHKG